VNGTLAMLGAPQLTDFDIAVGQVFGEVRVEPLPAPQSSPVEALETALRRALERPPCVLEFSGGRDSSLLLALGVRVARREGLAPPIPMTLRFSGAPESAEAEWQEALIKELAIDDWEVVELGERLDVVGEFATRALTQHGSYYPPNAHLHLPFLDRVRGGTVVTGVDGDGVFGGWRAVALGAARAGRVPWTLRQRARALYTSMPAPIRRLVGSRRDRGVALPWLTPAAQRELQRLRARHLIVQPARFHDYVEWLRSRRYLVTKQRTGEVFAQAAGAALVHPLLDPAFLASYAALGGPDGFGNRTETMKALFAGVLPDRVLERSTKARFDGAYIASRSREVAAGWDGQGFDPEVVDAAALRAEWALPQPSFRSARLLQAVWLRQHPGAQ
jgi:hypothetical protein